MIVVAIVGLLVAIGLSSTSGLVQSRRFDSAVQELALAAKKARQAAQTRSETFTLEFTLHTPELNQDPADPPDRYAIYRGNTRPAEPEWKPMPEQIWIYRTNVNGPPYKWTFDERGTITPAQMGTIVLQDGTRLDPGLADATALPEYLRSKTTNPNGLSKGIILSTFLGKITVVYVGDQ